MPITGSLKKAIEKFKAWFDKKKKDRSRRIFMKAFTDKSSGLEGFVMQYAQKMASAMIMNWMDARRIRHCRFCASTEQLRRHVDYMVCPAHYEAVIAQPSKNGDQKMPAGLVKP